MRKPRTRALSKAALKETKNHLANSKAIHGLRKDLNELRISNEIIGRQQATLIKVLNSINDKLRGTL